MKQDKDNLEKQMMSEEYGKDVAGCLYGTLGIVAIVAFIIGSLFGKLFL